MSKEAIVNEMITFIEDAERNLLASSIVNESKTSKSSIVNTILKELEKKVSNEN